MSFLRLQSRRGIRLTDGLAGFLFLMASIYGSAQTCQSGKHTTAHIETFESSEFKRTQTLRIWLPGGYHSAANSEKKYPVLYLFDGQFVLPDCPETAWLPIEDSVPGLIQQHKLRPIIIVGIDSGPHRSHEYLPFKSWFEEPTDDPSGEKIPAFLSNEVMPLISAKYRIERNAGETGVGGVSNGAVAALYALLHRPDLFGLGMLESPMLQDGNGKLLQEAGSLARGPDRVYIGIGSDEIRIPGGEQLARHFRITVEQANRGLVRLCQGLAAQVGHTYLNQPDVRLVVQQGAHHDAKFWRERFPAAISFLYPGITSARR